MVLLFFVFFIAKKFATKFFAIEFSSKLFNNNTFSRFFVLPLYNKKGKV